jgi:7,8-dihydropterin-6-yl-methyl-4-(beta-D-ribofuranosyl)aminobenzene 5'-phosphate synthase
MSERILLTVLMDNTVHGRDLVAEHGFAVHLHGDAGDFLFDTGQTGLLRHNARSLGLDLARLGGIGLSHGHYDHTGGLPDVWTAAPDARVFHHPDATGPHFVRDSDGGTRNVGMAEPVRAALRERPSLVQPHEGALEFAPGFFLTGTIPRRTDFEDVGGPFVRDAAGAEPDPIADDQALYFDTAEGVVVVLGCAHAGVVNTLRYIQHLTRERPLYAVLGGMHLLAAGAERLDRTVQALRELEVQRLGPAHCTGVASAARLWTEFPRRCFACGVGTRLLFSGRP